MTETTVKATQQKMESEKMPGMTRSEGRSSPDLLHALEVLTHLASEIVRNDLHVLVGLTILLPKKRPDKTQPRLVEIQGMSTVDRDGREPLVSRIAPVEEPVRDVELIRLREDGDDGLNLLGFELSRSK
eukprot:1371307-Amorphochlora_amoeboformis.AAC.1